jgi:hypothetical protein
VKFGKLLAKPFKPDEFKSEVEETLARGGG